MDPIISPMLAKFPDTYYKVNTFKAAPLVRRAIGILTELGYKAPGKWFWNVEVDHIAVSHHNKNFYVMVEDLGTTYCGTQTVKDLRKIQDAMATKKLFPYSYSKLLTYHDEKLTIELIEHLKSCGYEFMHEDIWSDDYSEVYYMAISRREKKFACFTEPTHGSLYYDNTITPVDVFCQKGKDMIDIKGKLYSEDTLQKAMEFYVKHNIPSNYCGKHVTVKKARGVFDLIIDGHYVSQCSHETMIEHIEDITDDFYKAIEFLKSQPQ